MTTARIEGIGGEIAVGTIFCLGRNYREHAREMGSEVPTEPVIFLKPATAIVDEGEPVRLPSFSREVHHEVEVVVLIGREGCAIPRAEALEYVSGYGIGIDLTARDVQAEAKKKGLPWSVAKGFDGSAPLSKFVRSNLVPNPQALEFSLAVNGETRQRGRTADMIFPIDDTIARLSHIFTLRPGDLIFTGTPEGVGAVHPGDQLTLSLDSLVTALFEVTAS